MERSFKGVVMIAGLAVASLAACNNDDDDAGATTTARGTETTAATSTDDTTATSSDGTGATGTTTPAAEATEADYLAAIERSLSTGEGLKTTAEQAECMAPRWLDTIGMERLKEHDVAPADIGDDVNVDGSALYDAFGACDVDIRQLFIVLAAEGQTADVATCVEGALTPDLLRQLMVSSIVQDQPDDQLQADFETAIGPCDELIEGATTTTAG
jgi:hypothetical protein